MEQLILKKANLKNRVKITTDNKKWNLILSNELAFISKTQNMAFFPLTL